MNENYEWDSNKAVINEKKHVARNIGITFEEAAEVFDDPFAIESLDEQNSTLAETRFKVIGRVKRQVILLVVYTPRGDKTRIISARYANTREREMYYDRLRKNYC